ncbi:MAG: Intermediate filament protein [Thelocarpon superellum]|nr:MAG: Intermediate filament protein [Thelocarpon superellum]
MAVTHRDVAIALLVGVVAWSVAAQWLPLLQYVAYAFIAGSLSTSVAVGALVLRTSRASCPGKSDPIPAPATVAVVTPETWKIEITSLRERSIYDRASLYPSSFAISDGLDELIDLILRNFVSTWYSHISRTPSFTNQVDKTVRIALSRLQERLTGVDGVELTVSRLVPIINTHLKESYDAEKAVRGLDLNRAVTESDELDLAIASRYHGGKLHPAATLSFSDPKMVQQEYLKGIVGRLLPDLLPRDQLQSRVFEVLVREILACVVLFPLMQILSDPDTWNQLMEAYGRSMLQDRKTVRKLRAALDEHASPSPKSKRAMAFPKLAPHDNERQFEKFIRAIRQCSNLSDARRFRSEVSSQLKKGSRVEGQDPIYLRRLETGKRLLDQKVLSLTAGGLSKTGHNPPRARSAATSSRLENATLSEVLHDTSGLSYFMEFMDRQRLMNVVQFWIVVDGFRNPLEDHVMDDDESPATLTTWTESDRTDLAQINQAYLSKPELHVTEQARGAVSSFLRTGAQATPLQYQKARQAILGAQNDALIAMEQRHFPKFKESDLFYKYLTSDESAVSQAPQSPTPMRRPLPRATTQAPHPRPAPRSGVPPRLTADGNALRRAAASSGDLRMSSTTDDLPPARRSIDGAATAYGSDDNDADPLSRSRQSIDTDAGSVEAHDHEEPDGQVVAVMEAALNDIMGEAPDADDGRDSLFGPDLPGLASARRTVSSRSSSEFLRSDANSQKDPEKPSIASLGLVNTSSRIGVFSDDDLFPDEEKFIQDEHDDPDEAENEGNVDDEIHEAAPGDLGLVEAISALTADIERLVSQDSVVDSLTLKAELTNNTAELRILRKSKASLQREIRRKELQRQQYVIQESDNSLYGRSAVRIKSIMVSTEEDGREYASYVIEVQRKAGEQMPAATWTIARRYSEFHDLQQRLRSKYPSVRPLEFPRRRMVMKLQKDFLHKRRLALEQFLRELLLLPDVCRSRDLRAFLSQQAIVADPPSDDAIPSARQDIMTRLYNSVSDGMDDFLGNIPVLDQLSVTGQNLISAASSQLNTMPALVSEDPVSAAEVEAELNAFENRELEPFVKPICDIFLEIFELNRGSNWLRGRAAVVILHQLLGGTIERKVRENAKSLFTPDSTVKMIGMARDALFPAVKPPVRSGADKAHTRREASVTLATLIPDVAGNVVGRANAQAASRRVFAALNNPRLNAHLVYTLLDEVLTVLFPVGTTTEPATKAGMR